MMLLVRSGGTVKSAMNFKQAVKDSTAMIGRGPTCGLRVSVKSQQETMTVWLPKLTHWASRKGKNIMQSYPGITGVGS